MTLEELKKSKKESQEFIKALFKISTKHMGLSPRDFWDLTLFEYQELYDSHFGHLKEEALDRDGLERLMKKYPD